MSVKVMPDLKTVWHRCALMNGTNRQRRLLLANRGPGQQQRADQK